MAVDREAAEMRDWDKFLALNAGRNDAQALHDLSKADIDHMRKIWDNIPHRGLFVNGFNFRVFMQYGWSVAAVTVRNTRDDGVLLIGAEEYEGTREYWLWGDFPHYGKPKGWLYLRRGEEFSFDLGMGQGYVYIGVHPDDGSHGVYANDREYNSKFTRLGVEFETLHKSGGGKLDRLALR